MRAHVLLALLVGCQGPGTSDPVDREPLEQEALAAEDVVALDVEDIRIRCSLDDGTLEFRTEAAWQAFLDGCVQPVQAPEIDWSTQQVIGASVTVPCPFAGSPFALEPELDGRVVTPVVWTWTDHCFCDYFGTHLQLFAVPADAEPAEVHIVEEVACEDTVCDCGGGETKSGCDDSRWCPTTLEYMVEVDGRPPE